MCSLNHRRQNLGRHPCLALGSSEHPAVDGNLDKPKAEAGGRRTRFMRLIVAIKPAQSPKLTRALRQGVSQGIPLHPTGAVSGPPPAALPCLGLPSTSGGPIHPHSTLTQAYCEGLVRIGLPGEQTTTTSRLPPRCNVLAGHGYVHQSTRLGAPLLATPQYSQHPRCCRRRSPELRACVDVRLQRSPEWPQGRRHTHTAVNHSPPNPQPASQPTRAHASGSDQRGEG